MDQINVVPEEQIRLAVFLAVFFVMSLSEYYSPRRALVLSKFRRWSSNLTLSFLSAMSAKYLLPFTGISAAIFAKENGVGLFNDVAVNPILATLVVVVVLDFVVYMQHRVFHKVPILWRLHIVHHFDEDIDVTTGARFHPVEIVLSMVIKVFVILSLGASVEAVLTFEIILNAMAMFNHSNVKIPKGLDALLRRIVVTPDFHRVHHSKIPREHHSNFGFNLSVWDFIFRTYISQPKLGHQGMEIGINRISGPSKTASIYSLLSYPFKPGI